MLALGLLGLADWKEGQPIPDRTQPPMERPDGYSLAGVAAIYRPLLTVVKNEQRTGATELAGLQDTPFFRHFRDLFGHSVHYESGSADRTLEMDYWEPVTNAAGGLGRDVALAFSPVTPERVNLRVNMIQQARQDLYTTLLGLGNNRWSNVQLAESFARLLTGRKIAAHLVERVSFPPTAPDHDREQVLWDLENALKKEKEPFLLADENRRLILEGMTRVVEGSEGTAQALRTPLSSLNRRAPRGIRYSALGKTGTPSTDLAIVRQSPAEPPPSAIHEINGAYFVDHGVLVLALTRTSEAGIESLVLSIFIEAQGSSSETVALAADLLQPLAQAYWPADWMVSQTSSP
jgi:cell division protein FtsI/penicillin-binding protein 2